MIIEKNFIFGINNVFIVRWTGTHTGTAVVMIVAHMLLRYEKKIFADGKKTCTHI